MSISHLLEDFAGVARAPDTIGAGAREDERIEAFEEGYKAGWQDAVKAASEDGERIASDFAANLQDVSFTLAEAQRDLLGQLRPLMTGMVEKVLPRMAHRTIGAHVVDALEDMARTAMEGPIRLVTAPGNAAALKALIEERGLAGVTIGTEPSLGDGQVHIRAGDREQEIDMDAVLSQIDAALSGFFDEELKESA
ncbi:FliH/SctL family protein [Roseovarius aquimarinus]|uniref:Flagellar biosynthesis protein n=1 Tax=Roseovarius aquimarinus TaxID=1229156 RepID=A0ABW7IA48_9RHOB